MIYCLFKILVIQQEKILENIKNLNMLIKSKSAILTDNLKLLKQNIKQENYNSSISFIDILFKEISLEEIFIDLKMLKNNINQIGVGKPETISIGKDIIDALDKLVLSVKRAEESDLIMLINLVLYYQTITIIIIKIMNF